MKRLFVLLLICLALSGCASRTSPQTSETVALPALSAGFPTREPVALYDPDSEMEAATNGAVKAYPISLGKPLGIYSMGADLILLSEVEGKFVLQKLSGGEGTLLRTRTLDFRMIPEDGHLRITEEGIACFDPIKLQIVVLDGNLEEIRRIGIPEDLMGTPLLSGDGSVIYYCTPDAIRALETDTGISRVLKENASPCQSVRRLHFDDTVLQCSIWEKNSREHTLMISAETGGLLGTYDGHLEFVTAAERYYAMPGGADGTLLFGERRGDVRMLTPEKTGMLFRFLPEEHAAAAVTAESGNLRLDYYVLSSGRRISAVTLPAACAPTELVSCGRESIWILGSDAGGDGPALYRWNPAATAVEDDTDYTGGYYTKNDPDREGLERCRQYAGEISGKYGVEILISRDDTLTVPGEYALEYEYQVPVLMRQLEQVDAQLGSYPAGFLQTLSGHFSGIRIVLVRRITGSEKAGLPGDLPGLQFWNGNTACIALAGQNDTALYQKLCLLIETVVITKSNAYDRWDNLNPAGFVYLRDYTRNPPESYLPWFRDDSRCFIDSHAMHSPAEDRASIMAYAMSPGCEEFFRSLAMQSKLLQLCTGIRDGFGLKKCPEKFLWEQYLNTSLAYPQ